MTARDGRHLLGSPVDIRAIRRTVGCVTSADGALEGWAWHPGDPDIDPVLTIRSAAGSRTMTVTASDIGVQIDNSGVLARPRGFRLPPEALQGMQGLLHVLDHDARDLLGSPLDPGAMHIANAAAAAALSRLYPAGRGRRRATGRRRSAPCDAGRWERATAAGRHVPIAGAWPTSSSQCMAEQPEFSPVWTVCWPICARRAA